MLRVALYRSDMYTNPMESAGKLPVGAEKPQDLYRTSTFQVHPIYRAGWPNGGLLVLERHRKGHVQVTELHATNGRKQLPKTGGDKTRQLAYIQHLERLTAVQTSGSPGSRIRRLRNVAEELNIPRYKWDPSPVKRYFDPSIIR